MKPLAIGFIIGAALYGLWTDVPFGLILFAVSIGVLMVTRFWLVMAFIVGLIGGLTG